MSWKVLNTKRRTADGYVIDVTSAYEKQTGLGYSRKVFNETFEGTPGTGFIPFEDLTEDVVLQWVKNRLREYSCFRNRNSGKCKSCRIRPKIAITNRSRRFALGRYG